MQRRAFLSLLPLLAACATGTDKLAPSGKSRSPRLLATDADFRALAERRRLDADLDRLVVLLLERAHADLPRPLLERKLDGAGKRLLDVSRELIRRVLLWGFAFRITGDKAWVERARREMLAVSAFPDWNPSHFLDVAEMTAGLAIGYDWLFDELPPEDRSTIRRAIVDKGIAQARNGHKTFAYTHNWGQVCIGGMVLGALAVEEDEPKLAASLLKAAQKSVFASLEAYKPDGVYPEGPGYWTYGTSYSVLLVAALRGTKNADWGVLDAPGLKRSAEFFAHAVSPGGRAFNFADGGEGQELGPPLFYLARELQQPAPIEAKRQMIRNKQGLNERFAPLIALWWPGGEARTAPLSFSGQGPQPVAIWRTSWTDPNALYFAIKAGGAAHNHAHMDAGSFALDLDGVRWAKDLGMQAYHTLESRGVDLWNMKQDSPRWKVFRLGASAHNTLMLNGQPHNAAGMSTLTQPQANEALIDLTPAFLPGQLKRATRLARFETNAVSLQDEISGAKPGSKVRWAMTTEAAIRIEGETAVLSLAGKTLRVRFTGSKLQLAVLDISRPDNPLDVANPNARQLVVGGVADDAGNWALMTRFARG
jgi:hypothetical protein